MCEFKGAHRKQMYVITTLYLALCSTNRLKATTLHALRLDCVCCCFVGFLFCCCFCCYYCAFCWYFCFFYTVCLSCCPGKDRATEPPRTCRNRMSIPQQSNATMLDLTASAGPNCPYIYNPCVYFFNFVTSFNRSALVPMAYI